MSQPRNYRPDRRPRAPRRSIPARNDTPRGTAAHQELLSKSPHYGEGFEEVQLGYRLKLLKIERELEGIYAIRSALNKLSQGGADRQKILRFLAIEVHGRSWPREMQRTKRNLQSLAKRLSSMADEVERSASDVTTWPDIWGVAFQDVTESPVGLSERAPREMIDAMRAFAADLKNRARNLGIIGKRKITVERRRTLMYLLAHVHLATSDVRRYFLLLAEMLTDAYEKYQIRKGPTPESLEKLFARHVLPKLK